GILFFSNPETGKQYSCTASMINTENGNIGITAAHCLFDNNGLAYGFISFSPGYDSRNRGPLGLIPVEFVVAPPGFTSENADAYDYGMVRMKFNDPNGFKLQQYTGANGWKLDVRGDNIVTTVFGYLNVGDMQNCP